MRYFVISSGRPSNVVPMQRWAPTATWIVPAGQEGEYRKYAKIVDPPVEVIGVVSRQVTHQRNAAIELAGNEPLCMCDDDLNKLVRLDIDRGTKTPLPVTGAALRILHEMVNVGAHYGGIGPTDNAYFVKKQFHHDKFVRSALVVIIPTELRYDDTFPLKEDYDFTAQHLTRDGVVVRCDELMGSFSYKSNRGGCQAYRTQLMEWEVIRALQTKWPGVFRDNPRREHEVLMRWKPQHTH